METHLGASDDWVLSVFLKRLQGRRISPECSPPYMTADGPVLVDRRSHVDRRRFLSADTTKTGAPADGPQGRPEKKIAPTDA